MHGLVSKYHISMLKGHNFGKIKESIFLGYKVKYALFRNKYLILQYQETFMNLSYNG